VRAQEILLESNPNPGVGDYSSLAQYAYQAGQNRKGDLASAKAVELAPKSQKKQVKQALEQAKQEAAQKAAGAATGGAGATPTPSP